LFFPALMCIILSAWTHAGRTAEVTLPAGSAPAALEAASIHFQSVANQTRYVLARDALADSASSISPEERQRLLGEVRHCVESEIALARRLCTLAREDSRIGFEAANHYFYVPLDLVEKVVNCRWLLSQLDQQDATRR
jgi:hypothetical protein